MSEIDSGYPLDKFSSRSKFIFLILATTAYSCGLLLFYFSGGMKELFFERLLMGFGSIFLAYCLLMDKNIWIGLVSFKKEDKRPHKIFITLVFVILFGIAPFL
jgi:hypothetical protein